MQKNKERIDLLPQAEIDNLYERPIFNDEERLLYFTLTESESLAAMRYANLRTKLYFILQLGYFKAKQQFYSFDIENVIDDAEFINKIYLNGNATLCGKITREYIKSQKDDILKLYNYQIFSCELFYYNHHCLKCQLQKNILNS